MKSKINPKVIPKEHSCKKCIHIRSRKQKLIIKLIIFVRDLIN